MYHLDKGIFLEDKNVLLEWGNSVQKLALEHGAEIIRESDRTIIEWGTHTILNGLQLELSNTFLLSNVGRFKSIGFKTVGDKQSFDWFDLISKHLVAQFGNPVEREDDMEIKRDRLWAWQPKDVRITLYLFEQHSFKLHLKIEQSMTKDVK